MARKVITPDPVGEVSLQQRMTAHILGVRMLPVEQVGEKTVLLTGQLYDLFDDSDVTRPEKLELIAYADEHACDPLGIDVAFDHAEVGSILANGGSAINLVTDEHGRFAIVATKELSGEFWVVADKATAGPTVGKCELQHVVVP